MCIGYCERSVIKVDIFLKSLYGFEMRLYLAYELPHTPPPPNHTSSYNNNILLGNDRGHLIDMQFESRV